MLINNIDISTYNAELLDRAISTAPVHSVTTWLDGAAAGSLLRQNRDWHNLRLTFLIKETNEDLAYKRIAVLNENLKKSTLRFDDIDLNFECVLEGSTIPERLQNGVFRVIFTLKNYHATDNEVVLFYPISAFQAKRVKIAYYRSWANTMGHYAGCFEQDEIYEKLGENEYYIDLEELAVKAREAISWNTLFLNLGVDINRYKSINEENGFISIDQEYNEENAINLFNNTDSFIVYYNRMQMDGFPDLPYNKTYPSLAWRANGSNRFYFYTDVGVGWNVQDITVEVTGRYFENTKNSNGGMIGADEHFGLYQGDSKAYFITGDDKANEFEVFETNTSSGGSDIVIVKTTYEDISAMPMRDYGIKTMNEGLAPIVGYANVKFNGNTLSQVAANSAVLTNNITIARSYSYNSSTYEIGKNLDIARVRIYHQGVLVRDYIPISSNLKNGFYNTYDTGMYDIITMTYLPWISSNGSAGDHPDSELLPVPDQTTPVPTPPTPSQTYYVIVNNGRGTGSYEPGSLVSITANDSTDEFDKWIVNGVLVTDISQKTISFVMPENNVTATAVYKSSGDTPTPTQTYQVYVTNGSGVGEYTPGQLIVLKANTAPSGYKFSYWTLTGITVSDPTAASINFYMPENDVTAIANYTPIGSDDPPSTYTHVLTVVDGLGSGNYYEGEQVTITTNGSNNFLYWQLDGLSVGKPTTATLTFYMPNNDVTATAIYEDTGDLPMVDSGWLVYYTPEGSTEHNYNMETTMGEYAFDQSTLNDSINTPLKAWGNDHMGYAFVIATPDITPTDVYYYSSSNIKLDNPPTRDKWNRFVIKFATISQKRSQDQYIYATWNGVVHRLKFCLDSVF